MDAPSSAEASPRRGIWQEALASALHIEWSMIDPLAALRCTIGVGAPLVIALALNQQAAGVFIAIGALAVGFGSFQGAYRSRAAIMFFCAAGMALSLFIGSLAGHSTATASLVAAIWAFGAGLSVALGPAASFVTLQSVVAVLVAGAFPADLREAAGRGLLVLCGGLVQIPLVVGLWPLRRFQTERQFVDRAYRSLADYAASMRMRTLTAPEPHTFTEIDAVHHDPQPFARSSELLVFRALLDEAERIRAGLAALSVSFAPEHEVTADIGVILREIADAMGEGRAPSLMLDRWQSLDAAADRLRATTPIIDHLLAQLRAGWRLAHLPAWGTPGADAPSRRIRAIPPFGDGLRTIKANLSLESTACRHAVRLAAALGFATVIYRATELPRGYWISITTLLVLRPEFRETYVRGITRILGTLTGAGLAALLVRALGGHPVGLTALLLVFVWSGYSLFRANYTVFTVCITGYVVVLLFLSGVPGPTAATYRALDTILGGLLALAIYRVWPTWESRRVGDVLASLADALARHADLLLGAYADPAEWHPVELQDAGAAARLARSNAEATVERVLGEPGRSGFDPELALSLLAAFRRYALGALALQAGLVDRPAASPSLAPLRDEVTTTLETLADALRHGTRPGALPPLRQTLQQIQPSIDPIVAEQTDVIVDSVDTMTSILMRA